MARNNIEQQHALSQPWWLLDLPDNCIEQVVELLPANEVACTLRLVTRGTADKLDKPEHITVNIKTYNEKFDYVPSIAPSHAVAARWGAPGAARGLTLKQRKELLFCMARSGGDYAAVSRLAEALGCRVDTGVLTAAAGGGHVGLCTQLLEQLLPSLEEDEQNSAVVAAAAAGGHLEVVQLLAEAGLDIVMSECDSAAADPMASAAIGGHLHICEWLAENGWDPEGAEDAFDAAAEQGQWEAAAYIRSLAEKSIGSFTHCYVAYGCSLEALKTLRVRESTVGGRSSAHGSGTGGSSGGRGGRTSQQEQQQHGGAQAWVQQLSEHDQGMLLAYAAASPTPDWQAKVEWVLEQGVAPDLSSYIPTEVFLWKCGDVLPRLEWLERRGIRVDRHKMAVLFCMHATPKRLPLLQQLLSEGRGDYVGVTKLADRGQLELLRVLAGAATSSKEADEIRKCAAKCGA